MPIVSHCPSLSPPADFCSTCGAAPLRVCLRKRASQRIDEISDCLLPTVLRSCGVVAAPKFICICQPGCTSTMLSHVTSCYFLRSHTAQHFCSPLTPHLVPWLPGATKAEAAIKAAVPVAAPAILDMAGIMAPWQKSS